MIIYIYIFISAIFSLIFEYEIMDLENITNSNFFLNKFQLNY